MACRFIERLKASYLFRDHPLPWKAVEGNFVVDANEMIVAEVPCTGVDRDDEVLAFIVEAVNAHARGRH